MFLKYLGAYPESLQQEALQLHTQGQLAALLQTRYGAAAHGIRSDAALYAYAQELKQGYLRQAAQLSRVAFDNKLRIVQHALGTHTTVSRVQGSKLKAKREIRIASLFRDTPLPFLRMIVVHELAHTKEREHGKAFYQLCCHMEPGYHRIELDLRLYLAHLADHGAALWQTAAPGNRREPEPNHGAGAA